MLIHSLQLLCTTHSFVLVSYIHNETLCTLFFLTELFFFDFYNIFLCLTPTTMYVHRRRTTPCNAYKKHENEKIIHCFDPKNGCFAIHVPTTTELWTNFELDWTFSSITLVRWVLMCDGTCASALYCDIILGKFVCTKPRKHPPTLCSL